MHTPKFIHLREIVSEKKKEKTSTNNNLVSGSDPHEALVFPQSISHPVELFPTLGHSYPNNGPAMSNIGIFRVPT